MANRKSITGRGIDSSLSKFVLSEFPDQLEKSKGIPCECDVYVDQAYIGMDSGVFNHEKRPYLSLVGRVTSVRGDFPQGVGQINFDREGSVCPAVVYRYEFSDGELSELCRKGLYNKGFQCPDILYDNTLQLPGVANYNYIKSLSKGDSPISFLSIQQQYNLVADASSGYDLVSYFGTFKSQDYQSDFGPGDGKEWLEQEPEAQSSLEMRDFEQVSYDDEYEESVAVPTEPDRVYTDKEKEVLPLFDEMEQARQARAEQREVFGEEAVMEPDDEQADGDADSVFDAEQREREDEERRKAFELVSRGIEGNVRAMLLADSIDLSSVSGHMLSGVAKKYEERQNAAKSMQAALEAAEASKPADKRAERTGVNAAKANDKSKSGPEFDDY